MTAQRKLVARLAGAVTVAFVASLALTWLLHDRMMEYAREQGADVGELTFFRDEQVFFSIPGSQFPVPIPYVLCFREIQFSGVLTKRGTEVRR